MKENKVNRVNKARSHKAKAIRWFQTECKPTLILPWVLEHSVGHELLYLKVNKSDNRSQI